MVLKDDAEEPTTTGAALQLNAQLSAMVRSIQSKKINIIDALHDEDVADLLKYNWEVVDEVYKACQRKGKCTSKLKVLDYVSEIMKLQTKDIASLKEMNASISAKIQLLAPGTEYNNERLKSQAIDYLIRKYEHETSSISFLDRFRKKKELPKKPVSHTGGGDSSSDSDSDSASVGSASSNSTDSSAATVDADEAVDAALIQNKFEEACIAASTISALKPLVETLKTNLAVSGKSERERMDFVHQFETDATHKVSHVSARQIIAAVVFSAVGLVAGVVLGAVAGAALSYAVTFYTGPGGLFAAAIGAIVGGAVLGAAGAGAGAMYLKKQKENFNKKVATVVAASDDLAKTPHK